MRAFLAACLLVSLPASACGSPYELLAAAKAKATKPDLIEQYGQLSLQKGELRLPPGKGPFPVAVVIHGGCWDRQFESLEGTAPLADMLTKRGIATWNIEYRVSGDPGAVFPATFSDIAAGVDHVRILAQRYPLDLSRSAVVGHSAGAHLALWAASRPKLDSQFAREALRPAAVAAIDGPGSVAEFVGPDQEVCGKAVITNLMGGTPAEHPDRYRMASPLGQLPLGIRTLLVKGGLGRFMDGYEASAKAAGDTVVTLKTDPDNHFDMITPGQPNGEKTADWLAANLFPAQSDRRRVKK